MELELSEREQTLAEKCRCYPAFVLSTELDDTIALVAKLYSYFLARTFVKGSA